MHKPMLPNDEVRVVEPDGTRSPWVKAEVSPAGSFGVTVIDLVAEIPVDEDDSIERKIPGGVERYRIKSAEYIKDRMGDGGFWKILGNKENPRQRSAEPTSPAPTPSPRKSRTRKTQVTQSPVTIHGNNNTVVVASPSATVGRGQARRGAMDALEQEIAQLPEGPRRRDAERLIELVKGEVEKEPIQAGVVKTLLNGLPKASQIASLIKTILGNL